MKKIKISITTAMIVAAVIIFACLKIYENRPSLVSSNQQTEEQIDELRKKAFLGDAQAKYALSLFSESTADADNLIEEAAKLGYGPAVVTFVDIKLQKKPDKAAAMLQLAANAGYTPAIVALVRCVESGQCGENSRLLGAKWSLVHRSLVNQGRIEDSNLLETEQKLYIGLSKSDIELVQRESSKIIDTIVLVR